jgi:hypothetical protein
VFQNTFGHRGQWEQVAKSFPTVIHFGSYPHNVTYTNVVGHFAGQIMKYLLTLTLLFSGWTSFAQVDSLDNWIDSIKNNQLHGTCHYFWTLEVDNSARNVFNLIKNGKSGRTKLIDKLTDKDRGVVCHYILSTLSDTLTIETLEMNETKIRYRVNGLEFEERDGKVYAKAEDLKRIKIFWKRRNE